MATTIVVPEYDEAQHLYRYNGAAMLSVTQHLERAGLGGDAKWYSAGCAYRGKFVHVATQYLDEGTLDWESVLEEYVGYVLSWDTWIQAVKPQWDMIEVHRCDPARAFAGTADRVGRLLGNALRAIVDIKTGEMEAKFGLQLSGYGHLANPGELFRRIIVKLKKDGSMPTVYEFPVENYYSDLAVFFSLVQMHKHQDVVNAWKAKYL